MLANEDASLYQSLYCTSVNIFLYIAIMAHARLILLNDKFPGKRIVPKLLHSDDTSHHKYTKFTVIIYV